MVNRHMEKCSASLSIREVHTKIMMRSDLTPIKMASKRQFIISIEEDMEKREHSCTWNAYWCSYGRKLYASSSKNFKIKLPYHSEILPLSIYSKKTKTVILGNTYTSMYTAALFTTVKTWKRAKCP